MQNRSIFTCGLQCALYSDKVVVTWHFMLLLLFVFLVQDCIVTDWARRAVHYFTVKYHKMQCIVGYLTLVKILFVPTSRNLCIVFCTTDFSQYFTQTLFDFIRQKIIIQYGTVIKCLVCFLVCNSMVEVVDLITYGDILEKYSNCLQIYCSTLL